MLSLSLGLRSSKDRNTSLHLRPQLVAINEKAQQMLSFFLLSKVSLRAISLE